MKNNERVRRYFALLALELLNSGRRNNIIFVRLLAYIDNHTASNQLLDGKSLYCAPTNNCMCGRIHMRTQTHTGAYPMRAKQVWRRTIFVIGNDGQLEIRLS